MHRRTLILISAWCSLVFCVGLGSAAAQTSDQIQMTSGARLEGKVVDSSPTEVSIDVRGTKRAVTVNEIKHVTFAEDPPELRAGRARILARKPAAGLADLKKINPASIEREIVRRDLQYYLAFAQAKVALSAGGDKAAAAKSMLAFVRRAAAVTIFSRPPNCSVI